MYNVKNTPEPNIRKKYPLRKIAVYMGIALGTVIIAGFLVLLFLPDSFSDVFLRDNIVKAFQTAYPAYSLRISKVHYKVLENRIECDSVSLTANDSSFSGNIIALSLSGIGRLSLFRSDRIAADILANSELDIKEIILDVRQSQYEFHCGHVHFSVPDSTMVIDTLEMDPFAEGDRTRADTNFSCSITALSASKVNWVQIIRGKRLAPEYFVHSVINAKNILMDLPKSQYELQCKNVRLSVPDSEIVADSTTIHPMTDDDQFFAGSNFRKTRFLADIPECKITGAACLAMLQRTLYSARSIQIHDASLDVLINKEKPARTHEPNPSMPNEILASVKIPIQIDSVKIIDSKLKYSERFIADETPAVLTADDIQVSAEGIANHSDSAATIAIHVQGNFMKACIMKVNVAIPVSSPAFSLRYSGSMGEMDLSKFNPWLEPAERKRIKSGLLQSAVFDIRVIKGKASGNVQAIYHDLTLATLDSTHKSEKGLFQRITSFLANNFKIRGTNLPDKSGAMKIGIVKRIRKPDDAFFQFIWFALRDGLCEIVGAGF
jgi:hypothetical protein